MSWLKQRLPALDRWLEGTPVLLVENGTLVKRHLYEARITEEEVLMAARRDHGVECLERDLNCRNRMGIPKRRRIRFKMLAGIGGQPGWRDPFRVIFGSGLLRG
jgi:hypothetical protein